MDKKLFFLILVFLINSFSNVAAQTSNRQEDREADRKAIRAHVESIFRAYINRDRATIMATHSDDWAGYFLNSHKLTQGIEGYMQVADGSINDKNSGMTDFKFTEFNVIFHGDIALIFYVADITGKGTYTTYADKFRSLDVYQKRNGEWIQIASQLSRHPVEIERRQISPGVISPQTRQRILDAREAVWRAWFGNDQTKLEELIPAEAIAIQAGNKEWENRVAILEGAKKFAENGGKLIRLEFPRTEIQQYGNTVILYTSYLFETENNGKKSVNMGSGVETFVWRNGKMVNTGWLLAPEK